MNRWIEWISVAAVGALAACGGDGGRNETNAVPDTTAPTVVSVTPANGFTGIATSTTVSVNFSESIDCATATASSVMLMLNGAAVPGTVTCTGSTATFAPQAPLAAGATFTLQVSATILDRSGNRLSGAFTASFVTVTVASPTGYRVSGALTGLDSGRGLVLEINGMAPLPVAANGTFAFQTSLADGAAYNVTIAAQPVGQSCVLANATGVVRAADVANLTVLCKAAVAPMGVVAIVPADAATGIATGTSVAAVFSQPLDCTTVTSTSVTLVAAGASGNGIAGATNCSGTGLSFVPSSMLAPNTTYAVTLAGLRSASGDALLGTVGTRFTTGASNGAGAFTVGGTVTGLTNGRGLTLQLNAATPLSVTSSGSFVFPATVADGAAYQVTVLGQPGDQTCVVDHGSGVARAAVIDVAVSCTTNVFTVSAVLTGLAAGRSVSLRNNGGDDVTYTSNGALTFSTALPAQALYDVTVSAQPPGQTCTVNHGSGQVGAANVTGISIDCVDDRYTVSFTLHGLLPPGGVLLTNNGIDLTILDHDVTGTFATSLGYGDSYSVQLVVGPPYQACTASNSSGVIRGNVTDVAVTCAAPAMPEATSLAVAYGIKQLRFSWPFARDASYYKLFSMTDAMAPWVQVGAELVGNSTTVDVSTHLTDWVNARYRIEACNPYGCTTSSAIDAMAGAVDTVGYFKAPNSDEGDRFGFATALSGDGRTLAIGAIDEASGAAGVDGNMNDESRFWSGAVYVFTRPAGSSGDAASGWRLQAYLKPSNTHEAMRFGFALSLSQDGNLLAVGAPHERGCATQVGGDPTLLSCAQRGAVYVFERTGGAWRQQAYIKGRRPSDDSGYAGWWFGESVALDSRAETLVVGAPLDDSGRSDIVLGSNPAGAVDHSRNAMGAVYVFTRSRQSWTQEAYLKASNNASSGDVYRAYGVSVAISGDGDTVAVGAPGESGASPTPVNGDPVYNCATHANCSLYSGAVYVLRRTRPGGGVAWTQDAYLKGTNVANSQFGGAWNLPASLDEWFPSGQLALDADGTTLAVANAGGGLTRVFFRTAGNWSVQAILSSPTPTFNNAGNTATNMAALTSDGNLLAIAGRDSVITYRRTGGVWSASTSGQRPPGGWFDDIFGGGFSMSADGTTLAVGAAKEPGAANTIQGDQAARTLPSAGAVYVY